MGPGRHGSVTVHTEHPLTLVCREELRAAAEQIARATAVLLQLCESGALDHRTQVRVCGVGVTSHSGGNRTGYTGSVFTLLLPLVLLRSSSGPYTAVPDCTLYIQLPLPLQQAYHQHTVCYCNALM